MSLAARLAPLFLKLDPETAHGLVLRAMKAGLVRGDAVPDDPRLAVTVAGLAFPNPLGIAAGFDKNAEVPDRVLQLGFGYAEVGSLTPRAQPGNPRPRIVRLPEIGAVINRLGFNNEGHAPAHRRLAARAGRGGIVGVNVGANKDSEDRAADYVAGIRRFADVATYFTVNVSSPNTPGLRDLQARAALDDLLARTIAARDAAEGPRRPLFLKIAPDVTEAGLDDIAEVAAARAVDGLIVSNTTLSRRGIRHPRAAEPGGLSGAPLFTRSTIVLAKMRARLPARIALIGVGGLFTGDDAYEKLAAGADLLQVYTGFIYGGPDLPARLLGGLLERLTREGKASVAAVTASATADWAARPLPEP